MGNKYSMNKSAIIMSYDLNGYWVQLSIRILAPKHRYIWLKSSKWNKTSFRHSTNGYYLKYKWKQYRIIRSSSSLNVLWWVICMIISQVRDWLTRSIPNHNHWRSDWTLINFILCTNVCNYQYKVVEFVDF